MNELEKTGYKDSNGKEYMVGDIVFNPCFMDYWVVQKYTQEEIEKYECTVPYCLVLWNDKGEMFEDIDVPVGFLIVKHANEEGYNEMLNELNTVAKRHKDIYEDIPKEN